MPRNLPFHEIPLTAGVNTNFDPETQALKTLLTAQNVDTFEKWRAVGKVPGMSVVSTGALLAPARSLHQYEYTSLAGIRTRKQLACAGGGAGGLYDITGGSVSLKWSTPAIYDESLQSAVFNDLIFFSSENQRALETGGIKYDGTNARRWGVIRPGAEGTVRQNLNSSSGWTATNGTVATETANTRDGAGSISLTKTSVASTTCYFEKAGLAVNFSTHEQAYVWVFLPSGTLQKLPTSGTAIQVRMGNAGLTNYDDHNFSVGELLPGWNLLSLPLTAPDAEGGTGAVLTAIDTIRFTVNVLSNATIFSGVLFDRLYSVDLGKATATLGAAGNVEGEVTYRVAYLTEYGVTSNGGDASAAVTPTALAASAVLSYTGQPTAGNTIVIDGVTYTWRATLTPVAYEVLIGASAAASYDNLESAMLGTGSPGVDYASGTAAHPTCTGSNDGVDDFTVTARAIGTGGNSIAISETTANASWDGGATTLSGGRAGQIVALSNIPVSLDAQVIARRIYRDADGDRIYRFVDQIDDNITTTYNDDIPAASLGEATMPIAGDDQLDSSPPERMRAFTVHESRIFGISGDDPTIILVSDVSQPEQFRLVDQLAVDEELVTLRSHPLGLVLYGRTRALLLLGNGVDSPFRVENLNTELGANNPNCVVDVLGMNIVLRDEEVYHVADPRDSWLLNGPILDQFRAASSSQLSSAFLVHDRDRYRVIFFIGSAIWVYQYGTLGFQEITGDGPGVGPKDIRIGAWTTLVLPATITAAALVEETADKSELWVSDSAGDIYHLQDATTTNYIFNGSSSAVNSIIESHAVPLGPPGDRGAIGGEDAVNGRGEPRYLLLNSKSAAGITWTATITVLSDADGATLGTVSFSVVCPAGNAAVVTPVPPVGVLGGWCRVKLQNNVTGAAGVIRGCRLFYVPRGSFRGVRAS